MSLLQTRRLVLGLALTPLWPATTFAQTPDALPPKAAPPQVQIEVEFATVSAADLDKSGIAFDRVPLAQTEANPEPTGQFLQYAVGADAARLFQTLLHTRGRIAQAPLITTTTNIPATIEVHSLAMQSGLTLTPRINSDNSITLSIASQAANDSADAPATGPQGTTLRTIRSGDMMVVAGWPLSSGTPTDGRKLLIFVTPRLVGTDARMGDVEQPDLPSPPVQGTPPPTGRTVSIDVYNAGLRAVVAVLERQTGLKALVQGGDKSYNPVYVHLNGGSQSDALAAIARSAGAQIIRDKNGVYVFSPLPGAALTPVTAAPADRHSVTVTP